MKNRIVAISLVLLIGSAVACGQNSSQAAGLKDLDRIVPRLPSGLSIEEVEGRLGEPEARFEVEVGGGETVLTYRLWQVSFHPNLFMRIRRYAAGYRHADKQPVASLDRKIRALKPGSARGTIEKKLGKTEVWQVLDFGRKEHLWYGNGRWKLVLTDRGLSRKAFYK